MMEIKNKKAYFNYFIECEYETGLVLVGSEIKSIREGKCSINDAYIRIKNKEAFIINMFIDTYNEASVFNHETTRERKLLLHKKEIKNLLEYATKDGYTLVPLKLYLKNGLVKLAIGIGKGKKLYDKRETIKKRDMERDFKRK